MIPIVSVEVVKFAIATYERLSGEKLNLASFGLDYALYEQKGYYIPAKPMMVLYNYVNRQLDAKSVVKFYTTVIGQFSLHDNLAKFPRKPYSVREALEFLLKLTEIENPTAKMQLQFDSKTFTVSRRKHILSVKEESAIELYFMVYLQLFLTLLTGIDPVPLLAEVYTPRDSEDKLDKQDQVLAALIKGTHHSVIFDSSRTALTYPNNMLSMNVTAASSLFGQQSTQKTINSLAESVTLIVDNYLGQEQLSIATIADMMGVSVRQLQYELDAENTSYKQIKDKVIVSHTDWYIKQGQFSMSEIAVLLGFSSIAQFSRSLKRITGHPPREYQKKIQENSA